ncbi:MAG TPA: thiamine phosphate synthase [Gemmatimonadaceae bacterium]|nr:thiamine phosphate synthase [Gemmatimonadaceae bacterium]
MDAGCASGIDLSSEGEGRERGGGSGERRTATRTSHPTPHTSQLTPHRLQLPTRPIPRVHAVTDDSVLAAAGFLERARRVMRVLGTRGAVHLRAHATPAARLYEMACALATEQEATGCWLVVNDRVDVALASGAAAAQLTSRSLAVADARRIAASLALGASVHAVAEARDAAQAGADWIVAGHLYATPTHPSVPAQGVEFMEEIVAASAVPCIAIGGIRAQHVGALRARGVYGVAAIRGIWGERPDDAERAAIEYLSAYDEPAGP